MARRKKKDSLFKVHYLFVIAIAAIVIAYLQNTTFFENSIFSKVINTIFTKISYLLSDTKILGYNFSDIPPLGLALLLFAVLVLLFSYKYILKTALSLLFILLALSPESADTINNALHTNIPLNNLNHQGANNVALFGSLKSYLNIKSMLSLMAFGITPSALLYKTKIYYPKFLKKDYLSRYGLVIAAFIGSYVILGPYFEEILKKIS